METPDFLCRVLLSAEPGNCKVRDSRGVGREEQQTWKEDPTGKSPLQPTWDCIRHLPQHAQRKDLRTSAYSLLKIMPPCVSSVLGSYETDTLMKLWGPVTRKWQKDVPLLAPSASISSSRFLGMIETMEAFLKMHIPLGVGDRYPSTHSPPEPEVRNSGGASGVSQALLVIDTPHLRSTGTRSRGTREMNGGGGISSVSFTF